MKGLRNRDFFERVQESEAHLCYYIDYQHPNLGVPHFSEHAHFCSNIIYFISDTCKAANYRFDSFLYRSFHDTTMTHFYRLALLLFCCVFQYSCQKTKEDETIIVTTAPEFKVDLFEQRDPGNGTPLFGLWISSVETFPCSNYRIEGTVQMSGPNINIRLDDVRQPDTCVGAAGPARSFMAIGQLPEGTYNISLSLGNAIENTGTLTVYPDRYELSVEYPQAVDFQNRVLKKIPDGLVWGYIATPDDAALTLATAFLADLKNITTENNLLPGFYGYFTLSGAGLVALHPGFAPAGSIQVFVRQLDTAPENLRQLLQQYRSAPQHTAQIRCLTTFGEF